MNGQPSQIVVSRVRAIFVRRCIQSIQLGYDKAIAENRMDINWEEDSITICLVETIKELGILNNFKISVNYQTPIYSREMAFEGAPYLKAPRVDFKFSSFSGPKEINYYAEAKNLSEKNWEKIGGAQVDASHYRARYIDTGIKNFLSERYPEGCLVGYVVNGFAENVILSINRLMESRGYGTNIGRIQKDQIYRLNNCYYSQNEINGEPWRLNHMILQIEN